MKFFQFIVSVGQNFRLTEGGVHLSNPFSGLLETITSTQVQLPTTEFKKLKNSRLDFSTVKVTEDNFLNLLIFIFLHIFSFFFIFFGLTDHDENDQAE